MDDVSVDGLVTVAQRNYLSATEAGRQFLNDLPSLVCSVEREVGVRVVGPAGHGATSVALKAVTPSGGWCAVKFDPDVGRSAAASVALSRWAEVGVAPQVWARGVGWYVMDWVPGVVVPRPLPQEAGQWEWWAGVVVDALTEAWRVPLPGEGLVDRWGWLLPLTKQRLTDAADPHFSPDLVDVVVDALPRLRAGRASGGCHGDVVGGNVVVSGGKGFLIDPVPHADPVEAVVGHWAARARNGDDVEQLCEWASHRVGAECDRDAVEAWAAINVVTFVAYALSRGRPAPEGACNYVRLLARV